MKIFVFADSHTDTGSMLIAIRKGKPDRIIHLGDHARDAEELQRVFPDIPMDIVKGNNDFGSRYPADKLLALEGKRFFITHGDQYGVKYGIEPLVEKGRAESADVTLFGHTHKSYLFMHGGMWVMNPGSIGHRAFSTSKATYGVVEITGDKIHCELRDI